MQMKHNIGIRAQMKNKLLLLFILCLSCGGNHVTNKNILLSLTQGEYTVTLRTTIDNKSLDIKWKEYGFSYPYILSQELFFYYKDKCLKKHVIPIPKRQFVINGRRINYQEIPIFDIELLQGSNGVLVHLYGADYCCGANCPEFNGLYMFDGTILSESISVINQPLNGKNLNEIEVDFNNPIKQETMYPSFKPL